LNGKPLTDYYRENIVPLTSCSTFLIHPPNTTTVDDVTIGDDIISFSPSNTNFLFDSQFSQIKPGDIITINYSNILSSYFIIDSVRYISGVEWVVRINGYNLADTTNATARIDRPLYDYNTSGILAVASANAIPYIYYSTLLGGLIVGDPRGATALGLGFHSHQINSTHYNLYLEFYPTGNPSEKIITLPAIDVSGNIGGTPGSYSLSQIVQNTNNAFRKTGYNYRFIAFEYNGNFGIMLADSLDGASFSILNGDNSTGTLTDLTNNIIGDALDDNYDSLGFGRNNANIASPKYQSTFIDSTAALLPTKIIRPFKRRDYIVNGKRKDTFYPTFKADSEGYWNAIIDSKTTTATTIEITYKVELDLCAAELKPGKSIIVHPSVDFDNILYNDIDYGRFIIKSVSFTEPCGDIGATTLITVINGVHATGNPISSGTGAIGLNVKLHFSEDSIGFNNEQIIDGVSAIHDYHRFHEVYINDQGKTFSHERARMVVQNETSSLLNTNYFHIVNVSPKLKGYIDDSTTIKHWLRFYVLSYDSTSGEYSGYLGKRDPMSDAISNVGPIIFGRKNVVTRFYDESNINFIDILFQEQGTIETVILTLTERYVDIEIFPSLQEQDELLLLATCEVSWDQQSSQNIVDFVINKRQFGSIDPLDFTESAIDFIRANDKNIHENGIFQGFEIIDFVDDIINFKGGQALVNGSYILSNANHIILPTIYQDGYGLPQNISLAICLTKDGNLTSLPLTNIKQHFFATNGIDTYYIQSITFNELIFNRKDLLIIAIANVTINSLTINNVKDVRRFINNQGLNDVLVWSSDKLSGHFYSFEALKQWIINSKGINNVVKIKGNFSFDQSLDFTGFEYPVVFEGEGAYFTINNNIGIVIGNNITLKNINLTYIPEVHNSLNIGADLGGCLYSNNSSLSDIEINNCTFTYSNRDFGRQSIMRNNNSVSSSDGVFKQSVGIIHDSIVRICNCYISKDSGSCTNRVYSSKCFVNYFPISWG
jgi:hypothetical protein